MTYEKLANILEVKVAQYQSLVGNIEMLRNSIEELEAEELRLQGEVRLLNSLLNEERGLGFQEKEILVQESIKDESKLEIIEDELQELEEN